MTSNSRYGAKILRHENIATTLTSYGKLSPHRQGEVIGSISLEEPESDSPLRAIVKHR